MIVTTLATNRFDAALLFPGEKGRWEGLTDRVRATTAKQHDYLQAVGVDDHRHGVPGVLLLSSVAR